MAKDTCDKIRAEVTRYAINGTNHKNPLYVANKVVVRKEQLDTTLIEAINVLRCPETFYRFYYAGINGALIIKTKQNFKFTTPESIRSERKIKGKIIYTLNGYPLEDRLLHISNEAIKDVDVLITKDGNNVNANHKIINIWTITKEERQSISTLADDFKYIDFNK